MCYPLRRSGWACATCGRVGGCSADNTATETKPSPKWSEVRFADSSHRDKASIGKEVVMSLCMTKCAGADSEMTIIDDVGIEPEVEDDGLRANG